MTAKETRARLFRHPTARPGDQVQRRDGKGGAWTPPPDHPVQPGGDGFLPCRAAPPSRQRARTGPSVLRCFHAGGSGFLLCHFLLGSSVPAPLSPSVARRLSIQRRTQAARSEVSRAATARSEGTLATTGADARASAAVGATDKESEAQKNGNGAGGRPRAAASAGAGGSPDAGRGCPHR